MVPWWEEKQNWTSLRWVSLPSLPLAEQDPKHGYCNGCKGSLGMLLVLLGHHSGIQTCLMCRQNNILAAVLKLSLKREKRPWCWWVTNTAKSKKDVLCCQIWIHTQHENCSHALMSVVPSALSPNKERWVSETIPRCVAWANISGVLFWIVSDIQFSLSKIL